MEAAPAAAFGRSPGVELVFLGRLLVSEATRKFLQRWLWPRLVHLIHEAPFLPLRRALSSLAVTLWTQDGAEAAAGLGIPSAGDAALLLLALTYRQAPLMVAQAAPATADVGRRLAEGLLVRASGKRSCRQQVQIMACEVLAFTFPCWQRYLGPGLLAVGRAGGAQPGKAPQELSPVDALERLALQALALYQEPHMTAAASALLMQVGNADVSTLLQVMGKAARRVDIGPAYASSALLVLQLFSQTSPNKVRPMLPRFAEALLRCLEPSDPQLRRSSLLAVTSALHELVGNFPMVDFHQESQKIAVGSSDGLILVYDLRTATKWRVFEGHGGFISAAAFSADGGKLASYSSQDCSVRVWQMGTGGLLGLLSPGRCVWRQTLPATSGGDPAAWRGVSLQFVTDRGLKCLKVVRESGDVLQFGVD